jgi:hypothetical protein
MTTNASGAAASPGRRRPRGICPKCSRLVALTAKSGMIGHHSSRWGAQCPGRNTPPADAQSTADVLADLLTTSANLHAFIETRAQEIARRPPEVSLRPCKYSLECELADGE